VSRREAAGPAPAREGEGILRADWLATTAFVLTAVAATLADALRAVAFVVAVALFAVGCVVFVMAYARAVGRSRTSQISVAGLFFLAGSAPAHIRRSLLGALAVQVGAALATAIARPYTSLAAGTLVPLYGLGLCGFWAARHGRFRPRAEISRPAGGQPRGRR
jgi:uncharacterized membrane protein YoaK (UPF0700 family)